MLAFIYLFVIFLLGDAICRRFFSFLSVQHRLAAGFLTGTLVSGCATYLAALVFSWASVPLLWANLLFFAVAGLLILLLRRGARIEQPGDGAFRKFYQKLSGRRSTHASDDVSFDAVRRPEGRAIWDWLVLLVCLAFGCWLMSITLGFDNGSFRFSSRAWNDFGANLSVSQSLALGNNFPTEHPFVPGEAIRYHFLFWFLAANLSFLGLNLAWSVNLLSLLSLGALLVLVMKLAEVLFGSRSVARIAAVLFFFAATSLSYIPFLYSQPDFSTAFNSILNARAFLNSGYGYRGENWGGLTIGVFIYQRHLISGAGILLLVLVFLADLYRRKGIIANLGPVAGPERKTISSDLITPDTPDATDHEQNFTVSEEDLNPFARLEREGYVSLSADDPPDFAGFEENDNFVDLTSGEFDGVRRQSDFRYEELPEAHYDFPPDDEIGLEFEGEVVERTEPQTQKKKRKKRPRLSFADFRHEIKGLIFSGALIGALPYWNSAVFVASAIVLGSLFILFPYRRYLAILGVTAVAVGLPQVMMLRSGNITKTSQSLFHWGFTIPNPTISLVLEYIGWTFGFKLLLVLIALIFLPWKHRLLFVVFTSLIAAVFLLQLSTDAFNNHKLINIWNVLAAIYAAYAIWIIGRKGLAGFVTAAVLTLAMTLGAIIDVFPLRNDGSMTVPYSDDRLTDWLLDNTHPSDVFLTQMLLSHPILFAGRKIFMGNTLFAWTAGYDLGEREKAYYRMFQERDPDELIRILNRNGIAYVGIDDGVRGNTRFTSFNESVYRQNFEKVFEDTDHKYANLILYRVPESAPEAVSENAVAHNADMSIGAVSAFEGGQGKGRGQFASARGMAVDAEGNLYVADGGNSRIQKFSPDGNFISTIGSSGVAEGELREPNGIAVHADGDIYVSDAARNRLIRFRTDGTFVKEWIGPEPKFFGPRAVVLGTNNKIYVLDQGRSRVVRLDSESDRAIEWGKQGSAPGELFEPTSLEFGGDRIYVTDARNNRIQVFDIDGNFIAQWPVPEWESYPWQYPDAAFDPQDKLLYVTSPLTKEIVVFDVEGNRLEPLKPHVATALENPSALVLSNRKHSKRLYVLNTGSSNIYKFELPLKPNKVMGKTDGNSNRADVNSQTPLR